MIQNLNLEIIETSNRNNARVVYNFPAVLIENQRANTKIVFYELAFNLMLLEIGCRVQFAKAPDGSLYIRKLEKGERGAHLTVSGHVKYPYGWIKSIVLKRKNFDPGLYELQECILERLSGKLWYPLKKIKQ